MTEWQGSATRHVGADYIEYTNVSRDDVHVLQCNASNVHGYLFANAFLNVLGMYARRVSADFFFSLGIYLYL